MLVKNTNDAYGEPGPWDLESIDALVDEYEYLFRQWAEEKIVGDEPIRSILVERLIAKMRKEFRNGLEIVKD